MAKDYTDYIVLILDSGERVYHLKHLWNRKVSPLDHKIYPFKGHRYVLELDRAYRIKWAPWSKLIKTQRTVTSYNKKGQKTTRTRIRYHPLKTLNELIRSKKIGLLLYQEPPPPREIERVFDCTCSCGFKGKNMTGTKVHVSSAGEGHTLIEEKEIEFVGRVKEPIEPMHISRIHQPSGELRG